MQIYLNSQVYPYFDTFTDVGIQNTTTRQTDTMLSDVDNDGDLDIIVSVTGTELFEIYINDGSGKFTYGSSANNGGVCVCVCVCVVCVVCVCGCVCSCVRDEFAPGVLVVPPDLKAKLSKGDHIATISNVL